MHILALHEVGSNNPDGIEIKANKDENGVPKDGIPFYPYYLPVHDLTAIVVFLFVFCAIMFFFPEMGGYFLEHANFQEANPLKTPEHIAPVWYFTPFYSMLRAVPDKLLGFVIMASAIAILFVLPWLDRSPVKSVRYKGNLTKLMLILFPAMFIILGILGVKAPADGRNLLARLGTIYYFAFFITMPIWTREGGPKGIIGKAVCWFFGLFILALTFMNLDTRAFYGTEGNPHPSLFLQFFTFLFAMLFFLMPKYAARENYSTPPERVTMQGQGLVTFFKALVVVLIIVFAPITAVGAETGHACGSIDCEHIEVDPGDKASLQRGAKWYMNYCYGCHATQYARYERVATDLGIPEAVMMDNLVFGEQKIGELMTISMREDDAKQWFGTAPPDLTLAARARSPEWIYTYLKHFYRDDSRPLGVNNKVFPDVGMPHALLELQGLQECAPGTVRAANGGIKQDPVTGEYLLENPCGDYQMTYEGRLSPEEFDQVAYDITNFLAYMSEPMAEQRRQIGTAVLLFLAFFFVLVWLLNREYWRDIH
jgi:ubiquinol-cytochrome c reductase cytochrome b subunit